MTDNSKNTGNTLDFDDEDAPELDVNLLPTLHKNSETDPPKIASDLSIKIKKKDSTGLQKRLIEIEEDDDFLKAFDSISTSPLADKIGRQQNESKVIINRLNETINNNELTKDRIVQLIQLSKVQQTLAVNNIMLTFETQNQLVQDTKENGKYDKVERKLIRQIEDQCNELAEKTYELNTKIKNGISYARIDKLEQLEHKHIKTIEPKTEARAKDKGRAMKGQVPEYYTKTDLNNILLQLKKAHKEMDQLLKMPDVDKRCAILAKLCDSTSALATGSIFLIPQSIAAIGSVVEYAISTVIVDSVQQGWTAARTRAQEIREKISTRTPQLDENSAINSLSKPLLKLASYTLSTSVGMLLGSITGVSHSLKAGVKNIGHTPLGIKANYAKHSTENGNDKNWKKSFSEIYTQHKTARDTKHKNNQKIQDRVQRKAAIKQQKKVNTQIDF